MASLCESLNMLEHMTEVYACRGDANPRLCNEAFFKAVRKKAGFEPEP